MLPELLALLVNPVVQDLIEKEVASVLDHNKHLFDSAPAKVVTQVVGAVATAVQGHIASQAKA